MIQNMKMLWVNLYFFIKKQKLDVLLISLVYEIILSLTSGDDLVLSSYSVDGLVVVTI